MNLRIAMAAALLAALPVCQAAEDKSADRGDVALSELVAKVHQKSKREYILDPSVGAVRISLAGMDADRIDEPRLLAVLRHHGLVAFTANDLVTILPERDARQLPTAIFTADASGIPGDTLITRIVQVRNACAMHMVPVLRPLMPQFGHMAVFPSTNTLIFVDHADNVRRLVEVVERIDKAAPGKLACPDMSMQGS